ncbi:hypothetical protein GCM10027270_19980 [Nocardioides ginkgobilobae]
MTRVPAYVVGRTIGVLLALLGVIAPLVWLAPGAAASGEDGGEGDFPLPTPGRPWFGPQLDWLTDSAEDYRKRLGSSAALYGQRVAYPLTQDSTFFLRRLVTESAAQGAVPVLSLEPSVALDDLDTEDATALTDELSALQEELGTRYLLRFAPEMNGTWYSWGQQPGAYVEAFRELADVVHDRLPSAAMVWSPVYGAGYPYGAAFGDVDPERNADVETLDTDGDGRLGSGDDPYGPYWPGPEAVDWVGLTLYHYGPDRGRVDNELEDPGTGGETGEEESATGFDIDRVPGEGALRARLNEVYNYGQQAPTRPFYDRFADGFDKPFLMDTGALWIADRRGDPEDEIKRAWWRQVLRADGDWPRIAGILWLEERRREAEARDRVVDWRATRDPDLAAALLRDLVGEVDLGPVTPVVELDPEDVEGGGVEGTGGEDQAGPSPDPGLATAVLPVPRPWWLAGSALSLLLLAGLAALAARRRPDWGYAADGHDYAVTGNRDLRLDVVRGVLLVGLVAAHVELLTTTDGPVARLMGGLVGPEAFVLVAGLAVGLRHEALVEAGGALAAASARWRRALTWWMVTVVVALVVLGLRYLPGTADSAVTHWLPGGAGRTGGTDLYVDAAPLLEYPPPWWAVRELFVLRTIPWPLSMLGLLVVLALVTPLLVALLRRRAWWLVLLGSWATYAADVVWTPDWTRGTWEAAYPPLLWQVVFVHGLVLAHHRREVRALLDRAWLRRALLAVAVVLGLAWAGVTTAAAVAGGEPAERLLDLTDGRDLPAGRLVALVLVALVAWLLLTACWRPLARVLAPVLAPVGSAGTTVLAVHVLLLVALAALPLDLATGWVRALATLAVVAVVLLAVRSRVLRAVLPG